MSVRFVDDLMGSNEIQTIWILSPAASIVRQPPLSPPYFTRHYFISDQGLPGVYQSLLPALHRDTPVTASSLGHLSRYGGPILYLYVHSFILFGILVWVNSGSILPHRRPHFSRTEDLSKLTTEDVVAEAKSILNLSDLLHVLQVTKSFVGDVVVDNVSFGVSRETISALLGPNRARKTLHLIDIYLEGGNIVPEKCLSTAHQSSIIQQLPALLSVFVLNLWQ